MAVDIEKRRASWRQSYYRNKDNPEWMNRNRERLKKAAAKNYAKRMASPELKAKHNAWQKNMRDTKPHEYAVYRIRNRYKVTVEEAERLIKQKEKGCEACGSRTCRMHIDHNHKTGQVRGILCHHCNVVLGMVGDNVDHIEALICYVERHK